MTPLIFDCRRIPRRKDFAQTIAGEQIVSARRRPAAHGAAPRIAEDAERSAAFGKGTTFRRHLPPLNPLRLRHLVPKLRAAAG